MSLHACPRMTARIPWLVGLVFATSLPLAAPGESVAQDSPTRNDSPDAGEDWFRPEADARLLKRVLKEDHVSERWIYQDLDAARQEARRTNKPMLVVFCCVPCGAAPELDGALRAPEADLAQLLDRFVCARMVKMNGVNRHVFRFDRDVPHVTMVLNADGEVYGRYGTRVAKDRRNLPRHKPSSFRQSLRRALALHEDREARASLPADQVDRSPAMAEDMATFRPFPPDHNPEHVKNCIHCHTVGEAEVRRTMTDRLLTLRDVWPFPLPQTIGLELDVDDGLEIRSVSDDSPAARAGIRDGDLLIRLGHRPLTSEADVQWVLHHAPDTGTLPIVVRRGTRIVEASVALVGDWRRGDGHWRESLSPLRPGVHLRPDPYAVRKGAQTGRMGLGVHYPRGPAADAGLRNGDLLIAVDGRTDMLLEADFLQYLHIDRPEVERVDLRIIRRDETSNVTLPILRR